MDRVELKRLDPVADKALYEEAFHWGDGYPTWYRDMTRAWGFESFDDFYAHVQSDEVISVGVFQDGLVGLTHVGHLGGMIFEIHLFGKRGADVDVLGLACAQWKQLFEIGAQAIVTFVASMNRAVIGICERAGMLADGLRAIRGETHGKVIEWKRMVITRQMWSET